MIHEEKQVLVTVKAYPNPSKKYGETVCVAGVDINTHEWIRLYPIPFRDLDDNKKFAKYSIIEVNVRKASDDTRSESYKVDADSIKIIEWLDPKNNWEKRKQHLLPTASTSFCSIVEESQQSNKSLGMFKPERVTFKYKKSKCRDADEREACYAQLSLYDKQKKVIEEVPFQFRHSFYCKSKADCPGHDLPIIDWEIGQSFRTWRYNYKPESVLLEKIKQKWLDGMCTGEHDTFFYVGNMNRFRENFMVLGVFYPKNSNR